MTPLTLRWRLALLMGALVSFVIIGIGAGVSWWLHLEGLRSFDRDLGIVAHDFFAAYGRNQRPPKLGGGKDVRELLPPGNYLYFAQIESPHGVVLYESRQLQDIPWPPLRDRPPFTEVRVRGQLMRAGEFQGEGVKLRVVMNMHGAEEARSNLLRCYLIAAPIVFLIVGVGSLWVARRGLAPLERITATAEIITARRLDQRLPPASSDDEIGRLTGVFNLMIDRLEASFQQAIRFTADASHELRTPLTIIRGELEAALRTGGHPPPTEKLLLNLLEEAQRLTRITDGLLLLSRADAGRLKIKLERVDLSQLLGELAEDAEILGANWEIAIEVELERNAIVLGEGAFLRQMFLNLIDNAIKYNERGGRVSVRMEKGDAVWKVLVGNTGRGISPESAQRLFDRFYRGDQSRTRKRPGHGLGLSICREIVRAHAGEIALSDFGASWTELCVTLPDGELPAKGGVFGGRSNSGEAIAAPANVDGGG
jgi:heavy metal sensor kinase